MSDIPLLHLGDYATSSWSLRGWMLFDAFGLPVRTAPVRMWTDDDVARRVEIAPARTYPTAVIDGALIWDTLAIAETLAERSPEAGLWPADPAARMAARALAAEMHSGFRALREACPMYVTRRWSGFAPSEEVRADIGRIAELWAWARGRWGDGGPFLFGAAATAADVFYAPVASRLSTYCLTPPGAEDYVAAMLAHPSMRRWRAMAVAAGYDVPRYEADLPRLPLEGPAIAPARAITAGDAGAVNETCPYSGKPVAADSLAEIGGLVVGFCNPFCRDKSVADAAAWPKLAPLLDRQ